LDKNHFVQPFVYASIINESPGRWSDDSSLEATTMGTATEVVKKAYDAFGRGDVGAILSLCAPTVDWALVGPAKLGYAGKRKTHAEITDFFVKVNELDEIHAFEPREFIENGDNVAVLGWEKCTARDTGKPFETEWAHVFTVQDGKVTRWRGFIDTAARYTD
jgi:uncharacterized protein